MIWDILSTVKILQVYILLTFIHILLFPGNKKGDNKILFIILSISIATEIISTIFNFFNIKTGFVYSVSIIAHHSTWLYLLNRYFDKKFNLIFVVAFLFYAITNIFFLEGTSLFNHYTFIAGGLLYIILFIYESFRNLKAENLPYFLSSKYILLSAPILFFFGLSFVFGFRSKELAETFVFGKVKLYDFIIYFVNIIYYTLINIYIYREKKLNHA